MNQILEGKLEFESYMTSNGENVCFLVVYDENGNNILAEAGVFFESKKVKITIEEVKYNI